MAAHFNKVGCHPQLSVALYAVDSLRQLATKFLEKDELTHYHFQKDFLKPFEHIILNIKHNERDVRDLVVECCKQMILARAENIKSGWKSVFMVLTYAAGDRHAEIVTKAYDMAELICSSYFPLIVDSFFVESVNCLVAFARSSLVKEISIRAVDQLAVFASHIAAGRVYELVPGEDGTVFTDAEVHLKLWFPILTGLSQVVSHRHVDVRTAALDRLFQTLGEQGELFADTFWELVFRGALLPIFDHVRYAGDGHLLKEDNEWLVSTCLDALTHMVGLFTKYFSRIAFLAEDFLALLTNCILQENENLASIGSNCLFSFVMANGEKWDDETWDTICATIHHIVLHNRCEELLSLEQRTPAQLSSATTNAVTVAQPEAKGEKKRISEANAAAVAPEKSREGESQGSKAEEKESENAAATEDGTEEKVNETENERETEKSEGNEAETEAETEIAPPTEGAEETVSESESEKKTESDMESEQGDTESESHTIDETMRAEDAIDVGRDVASTQPAGEGEGLLAKLRRATPPKRRAHDTRVITGKSNVQISLISAIKEISFAFYGRLSCTHLTVLLDTLDAAYAFAYTTNRDKDIWNLVKRHKPMQEIMSLVIKQENHSSGLYLSLLFKLYNEDVVERAELAEPRLVARLEKLVTDYLYIDANMESMPSVAYAASKVPAVLQALSGLLTMKDAQFLAHLKLFYPLFTDLTLVANREIRTMLRRVFVRIGVLKGFCASD